MRRKQGVSYGDILINRAVPIRQNAHAGRGRADVGLLVQRIPVIGGCAVKVHQISFHLVDENDALLWGYFIIL